MATYLRSIDRYEHPISTSFSHSDGDPTILASSALDFTMTHSYGASDIAADTAQYVRLRMTLCSLQCNIMFWFCPFIGIQETSNVQETFICS